RGAVAVARIHEPVDAEQEATSAVENTIVSPSAGQDARQAGAGPGSEASLAGRPNARTAWETVPTRLPAINGDGPRSSRRVKTSRLVPGAAWAPDTSTAITRTAAERT